MFMTEGEGGYLGGKIAEPAISSGEATGSNKSIVMPDRESLVLEGQGQATTPVLPSDDKRINAQDIAPHTGGF